MVLPAPRSGRPISVRGLLAALRAEGIRPHAGEAADDDAYIATLAKNLGVTLSGSAGKGTSKDQDEPKYTVPGPSGTTDPRATSRWIGIDRARFPFPPDPAHQAPEYGYYWEVLNARGGTPGPSPVGPTLTKPSSRWTSAMRTPA